MTTQKRPHPQTSIQLSDITSQQLKELQDLGYHKQSDVIRFAVARMYREEIASPGINVTDYQTGIIHRCAVLGSMPVSEDAVLLFCDMPGMGRLAVLRYASGEVFTPADWQGLQPDDSFSIMDTNWVDSRGVPAIMLNGMPTTIR